jgi:L-lysine 6-transaminase
MSESSPTPTGRAQPATPTSTRAGAPPAPTQRSTVRPAEVAAVTARHMLVDGFSIILDLEKSHGSRLLDERDGTEYLDCYTFFASAPLGLNPDGLADDAAFLAKLGRVAANKPANSDMLTTYLAEFTETFSRVLGDEALPHLFFIEGGALAVENALKVAFDWKSRQNEANGRSRDLGTKVLHLAHAFHGRTGYTLSLTNTDPIKVDRFPKFDWPRISSPAITFPIEEHRDELEQAEQAALREAAAAFAANPHDIACFIAEPIQAEGGDRHLRAEFLQAMQALCIEHEALFILDEVQTGVGLTGTPWCYQQLGLEPDVVAFGKKVQLGGIMAGRRVDSVRDNVFQVSSRINSTWGGNLVDMVRSTRLLEIIEETGAIENAATVGRRLVAGLEDLSARYPDTLSNPRGRGLLAAIDLPSRSERDAVVSALHTDEHVLVLSCGEETVRLRPALDFTEHDVDAVLAAIDRVVAANSGARR